ncbi:MAG: hypothetical protein Kow0042_22200 [Calditrichia bacterium]
MKRPSIPSYVWIIVLLSVFFVRSGWSAVGDSISLDDLRAPVSPAFVLLGIEPTAVEQPVTPKALALSLVNALPRQGIIPADYALEVAPYWLVSHPKLTFEKYYHAGFQQTVIQNLSFSLATRKSSVDKDTAFTGTEMGLGFRTLLVAGRPGSRLAILKKSLALGHLAADLVNTISLLGPLPQSPAEIAERVENVIAQLKASPEKLQISGIDSTEAAVVIDQAREIVMELLDETIVELQEGGREVSVEVILDRLVVNILKRYAREVALKIQKEDKNRMGFQLEAAGAATWLFPDDDFEENELTRLGLWLTPTYRRENPALTGLGVIRFIWDNQRGGSDFLDIGGRILWQNSKMSIGLEYINRTEFLPDGKDQFPRTFLFTSSSRICSTLEYALRNNLYLTFSFGEHFKKKNAQGGNLIAQLGVNFGFGQQTLALE